MIPFDDVVVKSISNKIIFVPHSTQFFKRFERSEVHEAMVSTVSIQPTKTETFVTSRTGSASNQEMNQIHKFYETLIHVPISRE